MKMETLRFKRANEKISRLKDELEEAQKELQKIMDDNMIRFKESDNKEDLSKKLKEISSEVFGRKTVLREQLFLLSLKIFIINDDEKERIYKITRYLFGDKDVIYNPSGYLTIGEYRDYLLYILNKDMNVSEKELSDLIHISEYSIKRNIEYRSKIGFKAFSK